MTDTATTEPTAGTKAWAALNGQGFPRFELPPLDALPPAVRKPAEGYLSALTAWNEASAALRALDTKPARNHAAALDNAALAAALADGKSDPGEKATAAHDKRVHDAARRKRALASNVDAAAGELARAVADHRDTLAKAAVERCAAAEAAYRDAVDTFRAAAVEMMDSRRVADWPNDLERRQPFGRPMRLPANVNRTGDSTQLADALAALADPPAPPQAPAMTGAALVDSGPVAA